MSSHIQSVAAKITLLPESTNAVERLKCENQERDEVAECSRVSREDHGDILGEFDDLVGAQKCCAALFARMVRSNTPSTNLASFDN